MSGITGVLASPTDESTTNGVSDMDSESGDALADLFLQLLELEHDARHQKRPRLVQKFTDRIDGERDGS